MLRVRMCPDCLHKQVEIGRLRHELEALRETNRRLRLQLNRQERTDGEMPFGSSTPSSQRRFKPQATPENQAKRGGAKPGHRGHGRKPPEAKAETTEQAAAPQVCPDCGCPLNAPEENLRHVLDLNPPRRQHREIRVERRRCPQCGRRFSGRPAGVLSRALYGNRLLAHLSAEHYLHGRPLLQECRRLGLPHGSVLNAMHRLAAGLAEVPRRLAEQYRQAPVRHADETSWRSDGTNGYAWMFSTEALSLYLLRPTRSASVVREVFGAAPLTGVLVVDRYAAYNHAPCELQYCYAHLLRDLKDLPDKAPGQAEVVRFTGTLAPLLAKAMSLRRREPDPPRYRRKAESLRNRILGVCEASARHPLIQQFQNLLREHPERFFHWTRDPTIPADNNFAERGLRRLVISRKISYGSQSARGMDTRSVLMSVLHTLDKRTGNAADALTRILDQLARSPHANAADIFLGEANLPPLPVH